MAEDSGWLEYRTHLLLGIAGMVVLYLIQLRNFLLFHSLGEVFSVLVAFAVFIVAWNTRAELENSFLAVLGVSYLFIGGVDLLHTLAYKGMGVFPAAGADLPTQLWIFARYLEAFSLVGAGLVGFVADSTDGLSLDWVDEALPAIAGGYTIVVAAGLWSIFVVDRFPQAYSATGGLTPFKIVSEYVIIGLLGVALVVLVLQRSTFDTQVFRILAVAIVFSAGSELAFTFYVDVYGFSNTIGHFLKFGSFYLVYLAVVQTGITEPQRMLYRSLAQREAEARKFQKAVEHSGHAVLITDRDGTIQDVNPAFEELTGYSAEELRGENPRILQSGEHDEAFYEELWATILAGEVWESEIVNERNDGDRYVANQTIAPITDADGTIEHFVGVTMDISERKKQEEELLKRYEALFNSIRDAIVVVDTDRRIINANPAFTDLFGYELADVEGDSSNCLYESDAEFEEVGTAIKDNVGESRFTCTIDYEKRSGQVFPGETTVFYLRSADDEIAGYISLITDVSERENRIKQLQILDRILRHNLRNDMNVIEGHATLIRNGSTDDVTEHAREIIETSETLLETVSKEHKITNFLSESPPLERVPLTTTVETIVADMRDQHPGATVSLDAPEDCTVRATPQLSEAIVEVIENALVHSDETAPTVDVRIERTDGAVSVRVADDGPGIPAMEQNVLTRETEIDPLYHGSGLGLWLVNLIVRQSDGVLEFEENDPRGSVVIIRLPTE